jgi:hypothetical protein
MTEAAFFELLTSAELLVDAADRCAKVAMLLADAHADGERLDATVLQVYMGTVDRTTQELADLRALVARYKAQIRTH